MIRMKRGNGIWRHLADRLRLAAAHPSRPSSLLEYRCSEGDARGLCGVRLCLLDLGQAELYVAIHIAIGEGWLDHRLGEQIESAIQVRRRNVENDLDPRQRKINSEASALGL